MIDLSIIIVNYNTRNLLHACLDSIYTNKDELKIEIIVIDNNSTDSSIEMVKSEFPQVCLICNDKNVGFAAANNIGLKYTTGEFILFLNSDTTLTSDSLITSIQYLRKHPNVGILGCKVINPDGSVQLSARDFPNLWTIFLESTFLYKLLPHSGIFRNPWITEIDKEQEVDVVKGAFIITRATTITEVGEMDTRFFLYSEEQDWCLRAKQKGWKIIYLPEVHIYHFEGASSKVERNSARYLIYNSEFKYFEKHFGTLYAYTAKFITLFGIIIRLFAWFILSIFKRILTKDFGKTIQRTKYYWYAFLWHFRKFS